MKKQFVLLSLFILLLQLSITAQQANVWYSGLNAGMDFNGSGPVALTNGMVNTSEGCAAIADAGGNLLFYTDGLTVYDRNHTIMPNGSGLAANASSNQAAVIVPFPASSTSYYIFTTAEMCAGPFSYSVV